MGPYDAGTGPDTRSPPSGTLNQMPRTRNRPSSRKIRFRSRADRQHARNPWKPAEIEQGET
jgi:hypothetical protein